MKEWALNHPWMTFLLVDSLIAGVVKIVAVIGSKGRPIIIQKGEDSNESAGDIH
jgi:hypothetical protein